jgi:hypothetical protein
MSINDILPALVLTQSVHAKISIGMHRVVKLKISRIPLIGLETRLGWRTDRKFLRNPNLNEIKSNHDCSVKMNVLNYITITCNLKNVRLEITFDYMKNVIDYNRLRLQITITPCLQWGSTQHLTMIEILNDIWRQHSIFLNQFGLLIHRCNSID